MEHASAGHEHSRKNYVTGFVLAIVLTVIPFGLVAMKLLPREAMFLVIAVLAIVQVVVHLRFFLNMNLTTTPRENILAMAFAAVLIFIMVGGTLWIMFDLDYRHDV
jgi:cytochrome o ubiquinol oxidase operon protein cyoD